ncbi:hypothetical protein NL676_024184 [Syzygium grande]|nr:hypothetical protein NL676_024184 [Syzygium grande]
MDPVGVAEVPKSVLLEFRINMWAAKRVYTELRGESLGSGVGNTDEPRVDPRWRPRVQEEARHVVPEVFAGISPGGGLAVLSVSRPEIVVHGMSGGTRLETSFVCTGVQPRPPPAPSVVDSFIGRLRKNDVVPFSHRSEPLNRDEKISSVETCSQFHLIIRL